MFKSMIFIYNLLLPLGFVAFLPGLLWKLAFRPGWKKTFAERFGIFFRARKAAFAGSSGGIWLHAVSVGETMIALSLIDKLLKHNPGLRIVLSTTTTTGQELARDKAPAGVEVIFAPIDFHFTVRRAVKLVNAAKLVIFETEIWPNLILGAKRAGMEVFLINARMSDHSSRGYRRFSFFFAPLLARFDAIAAQSQADAERFKLVSPAAKVESCGNLKFDQSIDASLEPADLSGYFGPGDFKILIGASTHPGEEKLLIETFATLLAEFPDLRLVLAPRHAERGGEIEKLLQASGLPYARRSRETASSSPVKAVLADTTGELVKLMKASAVVVMGKSLAGQDEGHNLIEPALLARPIVTGHILRNFRFVLKILEESGGVRTVASDAELAPALRELFADPAAAAAMGERALAAISVHRGAAERVMHKICG
ncbi:MAG: 3-deoxy-D-manno-octulosonic acid transferase [Victivallaceae bacterium]